MDAIRKLLDELMGPDRDGEQRPREIVDFRDNRVCKSYLLGFCVHDILASSKYDIGPCGKLHDPLLKEAYEKDPNKKDYNYEYILLSELRDQVRQCDRRINNAVNRFRADGVDNLMKMEDFDDVKQLSEEIDKLQEQVDELVKAGKNQIADELQQKVNTSIEMKASLQAIHLKEEQEKLPPELTVATATPAQKTRICNICGGMLSVFDVDQRLADHFTGKSHVAFLAIRKKLKELEAMNLSDKVNRSYNDEHRSYRDDHRERSRDSSRGYREYDRDRDHDHSHRSHYHNDYRSGRERSRSGSRRHSHHSHHSHHH